MHNITTHTVTEGCSIAANGTPLLTPLGKSLILPNLKLAEAVAAEWRAQGEKIRKHTMPLTHIACIAIDIATIKRDTLIADILAYCDTDVICYRTGNIPELLALQAQHLDPLVSWAHYRFGLRLHITHDIMPVAQPPENHQQLQDILASYTPWQLAVLASATKPLASVIIGVALMERALTAEQAFAMSHLEEEYQTRQWGDDPEKSARIQQHKSEILAAGTFLQLLSQ